MKKKTQKTNIYPMKPRKLNLTGMENIVRAFSEK